MSPNICAKEPFRLLKLEFLLFFFFFGGGGRDFSHMFFLCPGDVRLQPFLTRVEISLYQTVTKTNSPGVGLGNVNS